MMTHFGTHDGTLVGLSVLIATVAFYTALDLAGRIHASRGWTKHAWLATAALAMGGGVWAMHFFAMLAFSLPGVNVDYNLSLTAVSLVLPILATGFSFYHVTWTDGGLLALIRSGLAMGAGIVGMHYTGMAAMRMAADLSHETLWVAVSVLIAIGASTTALWLAFQNVGLAHGPLVAPIMGLAIAGMHYAAMQGAILTAHSPVDEAYGLARLSQTSVAVAVAATTFSILFLALIAALFDRRFAALAQRGALALHESEERYRALLEASAVVVWFATPTGMITTSHGWSKLCGQTESEYADLGWLNVVHPDDQARIISLWQQAMSSADFYQGEFRVRHTDGEYRWVLASAVPRRSPDGAILEWIGGISDIHARKLAEEKLQASEQRLRLAIQDEAFSDVADVVPVALWRIDNSFEHEWANKHWFELTGGRLEDDVGFAWADKVHPEDRERVLEEFDRAFEAREATTVEFRLRGRDGTYRWFKDSGTPFYQNGAFAGFVGSCVDITERKEAEMQTQVLQSQLMKLSRATTLDLMSVAHMHELHQSMQAIGTRIEGLINGGVDLATGLDDAIGAIRLAAERAKDIATKWHRLDLSGTAERTCEDLADVLHSLDLLIRTHPAAANATITWEMASGLHVTISRAQIEQVLLSFVFNALQAIQDMPVREISVSAVTWANAAVVSMGARGPIDSDVLRRAFDQFIDSPEDAADISGYVSHLIISAHGGRIWVDNHLGEVIIRFTLPLDDNSSV